MLDYVVMGMVIDREMTGYDIKKEVENTIGNFYRANYGRLYPALSKLADKGYLTMNEQMQGKRLKKYYKTTELGKTAFLEWLSAPVDFTMSGDAHLTQIFFYGELPKEVRNKKLQEYELFVEQKLQQLQNIAKMFPDDDMDEKDYFGISTLYYGLQDAHNMLRWLKFIRTQKPFSQFLRTQRSGKGIM
ncbi:MAG: PadR family transcriptional regulator [Oscillospiraceae bacterium]|nr:PadR family transcriptional regulator [Oscillospiraceae bacterium]